MWYPTETIEIRLILSSRWNEQWQPIKKVTIKKECRSQRGYQQMLVLSNLRLLDTREKEGEAKWLAGALKRKWHLLPSAKKREEMLVIGRGSWQTDPKPITPGEEDKNISWTWGTQVLQASVKNSIKSISPWKKKDSPVEPRRKIKVTLGLFLLYTQILYTTLSLSLSIWRNERIEKKDIYVLDCSIHYTYSTLWKCISLYSKEFMYFYVTTLVEVVLCSSAMNLLRHISFSASIRLMLSCLKLSY